MNTPYNRRADNQPVSPAHGSRALPLRCTPLHYTRHLTYLGPKTNRLAVSLALGIHTMGGLESESERALAREPRLRVNRLTRVTISTVRGFSL